MNFWKLDTSYGNKKFTLIERNTSSLFSTAPSENIFSRKYILGLCCRKGGGVCFGLRRILVWLHLICVFCTGKDQHASSHVKIFLQENLKVSHTIPRIVFRAIKFFYILQYFKIDTSWFEQTSLYARGENDNIYKIIIWKFVTDRQKERHRAKYNKTMQKNRPDIKQDNSSYKNNISSAEQFEKFPRKVEKYNYNYEKYLESFVFDFEIKTQEQ